ncbi:PD-(D/E)XK nuclease family protein [Candidatus Gottesmanbacteria bacterium]|nr:PD-(D/E)XK nuclease family protein [Candidatus Gottesmanbacteria bacterium]
MAPPVVRDKYSAVWVSYSSIRDYLKCPRAYFLKNVYRDPKTNRKITIMQPPLALGQIVHEVIESLSVLPVDERFSKPLGELFNERWSKVAGLNGGFTSDEEETTFKERGRTMLARVEKNPGPLMEKAIKIRQDLPNFWLSDEKNIILCGKIDWLRYNETDDSVHIIDFKTGKYDEDPESLQLPIYLLLATRCQTKPVTGASYWHLERDDAPVEATLPKQDTAQQQILEIANRIALARKLERFVCTRKDGCAACRSFEAILEGKAKHVGINEYHVDVYVLGENIL